MTTLVPTAEAKIQVAQHTRSERKDPEPPRELASPNDTSAAAAPPAPSPIVVERLTHQDIPEITQLYKRVWDSYRSELPAELVKAWQPTPLEFSSWMEGVTYFAARRNGRMIGAVGCEIAEASCRLVHLAVDAEHRRAGVGKALVQAAVEWARKSNCHSVWADALTRFTAAADVFRSLEFTECGVLHRHYWGEDVRLFERILG